MFLLFFIKHALEYGEGGFVCLFVLQWKSKEVVDSMFKCPSDA